MARCGNIIIAGKTIYSGDLDNIELSLKAGKKKLYSGSVVSVFIEEETKEINYIFTVIPISHRFPLSIPSQELEDLFKDCVLLNTFVGRFENFAAKLMDGNKIKEYKGNCFETFAEFLIKYMGTYSGIGIHNYIPTAPGAVGVDGWGLGDNGLLAGVQVKHRDDNYILKGEDDGLSFFASELFYKGIKDKRNILLITTGDKIAEYTVNEVFHGHIRWLNRNALRKLVDNKPLFWKSFYESCKAATK